MTSLLTCAREQRYGSVHCENFTFSSGMRVKKPADRCRYWSRLTVNNSRLSKASLRCSRRHNSPPVHLVVHGLQFHFCKQINYIIRLCSPPASTLRKLTTGARAQSSRAYCHENKMNLIWKKKQILSLGLHKYKMRCVFLSEVEFQTTSDFIKIKKFLS